jgi:chorismate dehydratase
MIRLGHIDYSNCVPVHAMILAATPPDITVVRGVPAELNRALAAGQIDVAPCSSIEFARHASEYRVLPGLAIGSEGPVHSIILESRRRAADLDGAVVAMPRASATSVVLLRALLELRLGVRPTYVWYDQGGGADPVADGADAALRIGDVALRHTVSPPHLPIDLGAEWTDWTGLPFAFAVWQVRDGLDDTAVQRIRMLLDQSREWFAGRAAAQAELHGPRHGLEPARLLAYWAALRFDLDARMLQGLLHFYELAHRLGEAPPTPALHMAEAAQP